MAHFRLLDRPIEKWSFIKRDDGNNRKLAIFVHGFRGHHLSTWLDLPNFLVKHAGSDRQLKNWDYLFLGYETYSIGNYVAIARLISTQWERASQGLPPYGPTKYEKLALFGHSLGTLGIRQLLCASSLHPEGMLTALKAVVLLGSPLNGSPLAKYGSASKYLDLLTGKLAALRPGSYEIAYSLEPDGAPITMLHTWNKSSRAHLQKVPVSLWLGADDQIVGSGGLVVWDGDKRNDVALDHTQICKIEMKDDKPVGHLIDILKEQLS